MAEHVTISPAPDAFAAAVIGVVIAHFEAEAAAAVPSSAPGLPAWVASARLDRPDPPIDRQRRPVHLSPPGVG
jgi:hypothetical protein